MARVKRYEEDPTYVLVFSTSHSSKSRALRVFGLITWRG